MGDFDLVGRRFGKLTVLEDSGERRGHSILWRCRCDCGGELLAVRHRLASGAVRSCGCEAVPARAKANDLAGRRFGHLTVAEDSGLRGSAGLILWRCVCDCGGEILATRRQLVSGSVENCGCVPKVYASKRQAEDLTGRQFGELTVLRRVENDGEGRVRWLCRCNCGKEVAVRALQLKSGKTRSCGCRRYGSVHNQYDLTGQRFGRLTALYRVKQAEKGSAWHCRCDCGEELDVSTGSLLRGMTRSCGCWNREQSGKMHEHMHYGNDTCVEVLRRACAETGRSKTGFRGLFQLRSGKYRASITFQGRHYNLGHFTTFEQAVRARLEAEQVLHQGYLRAFERYRDRARQDPSWAGENPFYYRVNRVDGVFQVQTNG